MPRYGEARGNAVGTPDWMQQYYLLNLAADADRLARASGRLHAQRIPFDRFAAIAAPAAGASCNSLDHTSSLDACAASHRALLQLIYDRGHERAVIFEDDVVLRDDAMEWLDRIMPQLDAIAWDVFYLGVHLMEDGGPITENLGRVGRGHHTHAYAVTRMAIPKLIACIDRPAEQCRYTFDAFDDPTLLKVYARPILAIQEPSFSHTQGKFVNRLPEYFAAFDEREFLAHCAEARRWSVGGRAIGGGRAHQSGRARDNGRGNPMQSRTVPVPRQATHRDSLARSAMEHQRGGRWTQAEPLWRRVLEIEPEHPAALHNCGLCAYQRGEHAAALDLLFRSIAADPACAAFHVALAGILKEAGRCDDAIELLDEAIRLDPHLTSAHCQRAAVLESLGRSAEAEQAWRRAVELDAGDFAAANGLGTLLYKSRLRQAVAINPCHADAQLLLGNALRESGDLQGAVAAYRRCVELLPAAAEAHGNLGAALHEIGELEEAVISLEKAIALKPTAHDAHWNLGLVLLHRGEFGRGWIEYEWRRHLKDERWHLGRFPQPEWSGQEIAGRTILVCCEQALGDAIQFIRYAPLLAARRAKVFVECPPKLCRLLRGVGGIDRVIARGEPLPAFDTHVRLLSLPGIFHTTLQSIPAEVPYLRADDALIEQWRTSLPADGINVGIAWQGNTGYAGDRFRSIPLAKFAPLAAVSGARFWSLQKGSGQDQIATAGFSVRTFDQPLDEQSGAFMDTAAFMKSLDLVITSDTSVAHLAGALGVRTWVALPHVADWRWMSGRPDSPWYPTMRLFRQEKPGDWEGVFARMAAELHARVHKDAPPALAQPLVGPMSAGQLIDRITILEIKTDRLADARQLCQARAELAWLKRLKRNALSGHPQLSAFERELREVNEALWETEDALRACERGGDFGSEFVGLARQVYLSNDRRAAIKGRIDALTGSVFSDFKSYATIGGNYNTPSIACRS